MKVLLGIQCRTASKRFPGKIYQEICGKSLLRWIFDTAKACADENTDVKFLGPEVDEKLKDYCNQHQFPLIQPKCNENDLVARYEIASQGYTHLVRLTADCWRHDINIIKQCLENLKSAHYTSNTILRTFPEGFDVQGCSVEAFKWIKKNTTNREHPFWDFDMNKSIQDNFTIDHKLTHILNKSHSYLVKFHSIDTKEDYEFWKSELERKTA